MQKCMLSTHADMHVQENAGVPQGSLRWEWAAVSASPWRREYGEGFPFYQVSKHLASHQLDSDEAEVLLSCTSALPTFHSNWGLLTFPLLIPILLQRHIPVQCGREAHFSILLHWISSPKIKINSASQREKYYYLYWDLPISRARLNQQKSSPVTWPCWTSLLRDNKKKMKQAGWPVDISWYFKLKMKSLGNNTSRVGYSMSCLQRRLKGLHGPFTLTWSL